MSCSTGAILDATIGLSSGVYRVLVYPLNTITQMYPIIIQRDGVTFWQGSISAALLPTGDTPQIIAQQILDAALQV